MSPKSGCYVNGSFITCCNDIQMIVFGVHKFLWNDLILPLSNMSTCFPVSKRSFGKIEFSFNGVDSSKEQTSFSILENFIMYVFSNGKKKR